MLDASAAETLLFELIDEQLRDRLAESDEAVIKLVVQFGLEGLREMAARLLDQRQQIDWDYWRGETPGRLLERWEKFWRDIAPPAYLGQDHRLARDGRGPRRAWPRNTHQCGNGRARRSASPAPAAAG